MAEKQLDFLVAYADGPGRLSGRPVPAGLANFPVHFEPACILMPRQMRVMLVGPESKSVCRLPGGADSGCTHTPRIHPPDEDYP